MTTVELQLSMQLPDQLDKGLAALRVQPCRRLVEKDDAGSERQRPRQTPLA